MTKSTKTTHPTVLNAFIKNAKSAVFISLFVALFVSTSLAQFSRPQGIKTVIVLTAAYSGSTAPAITDTQWATVFNASLSPYYTAATTDRAGGTPRSSLTFTFRSGSSIGGPSPYPLPMSDNGVFDDPMTLYGEGLAALVQFDALNPGLMLDPDRRLFVIVVNGQKRARATTVYPFKTSLNLWVNLSISVISEPAGAAFTGSQISLTSTGAGGATTTVIDSRTPAVMAHELGHNVGLPDLYREQEESPGEEFTGQWCVMGANKQNNFSGWSRQYQKWLPSDKIFVPPTPAPGTTFTANVDLFPPRTTTAFGQTELIMIPTDEQLRDWSPTLAAAGQMFGITSPGGPHFTGYLIENRGQIGLDAEFTSTTTPAGTSLGLNFNLGLESGRDQGLVVSYAKPWIPGQRRPPLNPLNVIHVPNTDGLNDAAFNNDGNFVGNPAGAPNFFVDDSRGVRITPLRNNANGSITVQVSWTMPPRPLLTVRDTWIDSPGNGFGTFFFGGNSMGTNPPRLSGDPVFFPVSVVWRTGLFGVRYPTFATTPTAHRVQIRVRNSGSVPISRIRGRVWIVEPQFPDLNVLNPQDIPGSFVRLLDSINPLREVSLDSSNSGTFALIGGGGPNLAPNQEANFTISHTPDTLFGAIVLLDRVDGVPTGGAAATREPVESMYDNFILEPYLLFTTIPGSPYAPINLELPIRNMNRDKRVFMAAIDGTGNGEGSQPGTWWRTSLEPVSTQLETREETLLKVQVRPPDPPEFKPQVTELGLTAWMNYNDAMIPICRLPFSVVTTRKTSLTVEMDSKGNLKGRLTAQDVDGRTITDTAGSKIVVTWSSSDGQSKQLIPGDPDHQATTNSQGQFEQPNSGWIQMRPGVRYVAVAQFMGSEQYGPAESEPAILDLSDDSGGPDLFVLRRLATDSFSSGQSRGTRSPIGAIDLLRRGETVNLAVVLTNLGARQARESLMRAYASKDEFLDVTDTPLGSTKVHAIAPQRQSNVNLRVARRKIGDAAYILFAVDANQAIAESNENNNVRAFRIKK